MSSNQAHHIQCIEDNYRRMQQSAEDAFASKKIKANLPVYRSVCDDMISEISDLTDADLATYGAVTAESYQSLLSHRLLTALRRQEAK